MFRFARTCQAIPFPLERRSSASNWESAREGSTQPIPARAGSVWVGETQPADLVEGVAHRSSGAVRQPSRDISECLEITVGDRPVGPGEQHPDRLRRTHATRCCIARASTCSRHLVDHRRPARSSRVSRAARSVTARTVASSSPRISTAKPFPTDRTCAFTPRGTSGQSGISGTM